MAWKRNMLILTAPPGRVQKTHHDAEGSPGRHVSDPSPIIAVAGSIALALSLIMGTGQALAGPPTCTGASVPTLGGQTCDVDSTTDQSTIFFAPSEGRTLALGGAVDFTFDVSTFGLVFQGFDALGKTGTSTVTLSDSTSNADLDLWIDAGRLIAGTDQLGDLGRVRLAGAGTLELSGDLALGSIEGSGEIALQSHNLSVGYDATTTTFSGVISGDGGLRKYGTGTLKLTGTNQYTGDTIVAGEEVSGSFFTSSLDISGGSLGGGNLILMDSAIVYVSGTSDLGASYISVDANSSMGISSGGSLGSGQLENLGGVYLTSNGTLGAAQIENRLNLYLSDVSSAGSATIENISDPSGYPFGQLVFEGSASAATANITNGSLLYFQGSATAANASILNEGTMYFSAQSTAGNAILTNASDAALYFFGQSVAGNATIQSQGALVFDFSSSADEATITSDYTLAFRGSSSAGTASITINEYVTNFVHYDGYFEQNATAGDADIEIAAGAIVVFDNSATAGTASINVQTGSYLDFAETTTAGAAEISTDGFLRFFENSTSGNATITNTGTMLFRGTSSAGNATIENFGNLYFNDMFGASNGELPTAGNATITNHGMLEFFDSTLGAATLVVKSGGVASFVEDASAGTGSITLESGAQLWALYSNTGIDVATLSAAQGSVIYSGAHTFTVGSSGLDASIGSIVGSKLAKTGSGILNISGDFNLSSGIDLVEGGISFTNTTSLIGQSSGPITTFGSLLDYGSGTNVASPVVINSSTTQFQVLSGSATQSGAISEAGGPRPFEKIGAGTLVLSGINTFSGPTTITGGTLSLEGGSALSDSSAVTITSGATLALGANETIGSFSGAGSINLGANELIAGGNNASTTFSGSLSGTGGNLLKVGTGTLTLSGTNTNSGFVWASVGTIEVANGSAISDASRVLVNPGSTLRLLNNETIGSIEGVISGGGTVDLGTNNLTIGTNAYSTNWTGTITGAGGSLTKVGLGDLTLSSANSYTGGTTVTDGVSAGPDGVLGTSDDTYGQLRIRESGTLGSGNLTIGPGGYVNFADSTSAGSAAIQSSSLLGFLGNSTAGSATIVLNDCNCFFYEGFVRDNASAGSASFDVGSAASLLFDGNATGGTSNLNIQAGGRIEFQGNATAAQSSITNSGILRFRDNAAIGTSSIVLNDAGLLSIFYLTNGGMSINSLTVNGSAGQISLGSNQLTLGGSGANSTIGASIFGTGGGLTKTGAGTLTLSGNNTYTGTTLVQTGALEALGGTAIGDASAVSLASATTLSLGASETIGSLAGLGAVNLGNSTLTTGGNNGSTTFSGILSGTGGLTKAGTGTMTLSGANSFTGATNVGGGTLSLLGGSALADSSAVTVVSGATLSLGASETIGSLAGAGSLSLAGNVLTSGGTNASTLFSGVISGTGGKLVKMGSGLLTLSGNNTFTGGIDLMQGSIGLASNTAAGTGPITTFGSVIDYADGVTIASPIVINSSTTQFQVLSGSATQSGAIGQSGGSRPFEKIGAGTLVLSGINTFSGPTTISGGTLSLLGGSALSNSSAVTVASDATLSLGASEAIGSLAGSGSVSLGSSTLTTGGNSTTTTFSGGISGTGGLTKEGSGTLTLSGINGFSGETLVNAGTLALSGGAALLDSSPVTVASGATLDLLTSESVGNLVLYGTVNLNGNGLILNNGLSAPAETGSLNLGGGSLVLNGTGAHHSYSGKINGSGQITVNGPVNLDLSGDLAANVINNATGGHLGLTGRSVPITFSGNLVNNSTLKFWNGPSWLGGSSQSVTFTGLLAGAGEIEILYGQTNFAGTSAHTGITRITSAVLNVLGGQALGDLSTVEMDADASLVLQSSETIGSLNGAGTVVLGANTLTTGGNGGTTLFSGSMTGSGGFTKVGSGTQVLSGVNSFSGPANVTGGTLSLLGGSALSDSSAVTIASGATLSVGTSETVGSIAGVGMINLGSAVLTTGINNTATTFSGGISGSGGLTKAGSGIFSLLGTNTFTGATSITGGTLSLAGGSALSDVSAITVASGAALSLGANETVGSLAGFGSVSLGSSTLTTGGNNTTTTFSGSLSGTGGLTKSGSGAFTLSGANTFTGATTINAGSVSLLGGSALSDLTALTVASGASLSLGASETIGSLAGAGSLSLAGNVLTSGGTNASTLFSGVISGTGGKLVKMGSGLLTLSGNNTFTGGIDLMQGGISLASNNAAGTGPITTFGSVIDYADGVTIASPIVINSSTTQFQVLSGSATQSGAIGQSGGSRPFEKIGAGTLVLSGTNSFSGPTTISGGTLAVSGGNALLDSANVLVSSGSSFRVQGSETIGLLSGNGSLLLNSGAVLTMGGTNASWTFGGTSSGAGGLIKSGSGELSLTGAHGFTGSLAVNGGSLRLAPGGSLSGLNSLNIGSGTRLDLSSTAQVSTISMTIAEGATLQAFLTPTAFPKITVSGVANLAGTFVANIDPATFVAAGQSRYDFNGIITGAVSGTFSSVVLNDPSGVFEAKPAYNSFDLVIQPSALPGNTLGMQAADTFTPSVSERTNTLRSPGCTVAGDTWCFRRYAQAEPTVATDAVSDIDPFAWAETGLRDAGSFSLWGRGVGAWSRMDGRGAAPDSRQETYGLIMGADRVIDSSLLIGFASQYTRTNSDFSGTLSGSSIEAVQAGVYMSLGDIDAHLDASASVSGSQARTRRHIDAGGVDQIARARFQAIAFLLSAEVGTVFETEDLFRIEPLAGFSFALQDTDDYRESNDGGAALIMSPEDLMSFRTSLGARISKVYDLGDRKLVPQFRLQWKHEALDVRPSFQAAFDTAPTTLFDLKGTSRARDALDFGLSGTMPVTGRITGYVDMSGLISEDTRTGAISVGARATW